MHRGCIRPARFRLPAFGVRTARTLFILSQSISHKILQAIQAFEKFLVAGEAMPHSGLAVPSDTWANADIIGRDDAIFRIDNLTFSKKWRFKADRDENGVRPLRMNLNAYPYYIDIHGYLR